MKKIYFSFLLGTGFLSGIAQSNVIHWDFNSSVNDESVVTGTNIPATGIGAIQVIGGVTQTYATGHPNDLNTTDNSGYQTTSYPTQGNNPKTAGIQFDADASGYNNLKLEFYQRLSNTAANTWVLQYTTDNTGVSSGGTVIWTDATTYTFTPASTGTGDTWYFRTFDFSSVSALNNNPNVGFRIVSDFDPNIGQYLAARSTSTYGGGTCRFDLIRVFEAEADVSIAVAQNFVVVDENAGTINVPVTIANANQAQVELTFGFSTYSNATENDDFTFTNTLVIPANSNGIFDLPITIIDDADAEKAERIIVKISSAVNGLINSTNNYQIIFIKDNDYQAPTPTNELGLTLLSSFSNGPSGTNSAEIVDFDPSNNRLFLANSIAGKLDIIDFNDPSNPSLISSVDISVYGGINSVVANNGVVAMAIENSNAQLDGFVVFLDENGVFINQVTVGPMPDMITYNKDYTKLITANEGEPNADYSIDPEGSVSIIDLTPGIVNLTNSNVSSISLTQFNGQEAALVAQGIRIFSSSASAAQCLEPEYVTVSDDNTKAYVTMQENNALLIIDLTNNSIVTMLPLGKIPYTTGSNNALDASDQSGHILITGDLPIYGIHMPDAMAYTTINGNGYILTANEGDSREFGAVADAKRIGSGSFNLDPTVFPDAYILKNNKFLGRLNGLTYSGDTDMDGDMDEIHVMGGRSFSIWDAANGSLVFDSKDLFEQITSTHPEFGAIFNASNSAGTPTLKNRSDDKGPEPEGIAVQEINGKPYAFIGLERIGGVLVFNIADPTSPVYVGYYNNRSTTVAGPDLGTEGIITIPAEISPNGNTLVILANEISSTLSIYQINTCAELSGAEITASSETICQGDIAELTINGSVNSSYQWLLNGNSISNETALTYEATTAGSYAVEVVNNTLACTDISLAKEITVNVLPTVVANDDFSVCQGEEITLTASGATTFDWDNSVDNGVAFTATSTTTYTVIGTDDNNCQNTADVSVTVFDLPVVTAPNDFTACAGDAITLVGSGATSYSWDNSVENGLEFNIFTTQTYTVVGIDDNLCENTAQVTITVNEVPALDAGDDVTVCLNNFPITITATGNGTSYAWDEGTLGETITISEAGTYNVTSELNGCESTDEVTVVADACTGIEEIISSATVYPNPFNSGFLIELTKVINGNISIYALDGKLMEQFTINASSITIQTENYPSGTYVLQVNSEAFTTVIKLVKN
jgi:hypothetical protein